MALLENSNEMKIFKSSNIYRASTNTSYTIPYKKSNPDDRRGISRLPNACFNYGKASSHFVCFRGDPLPSDNSSGKKIARASGGRQHSGPKLGTEDTAPKLRNFSTHAVHLEIFLGWRPDHPVAQVCFGGGPKGSFALSICLSIAGFFSAALPFSCRKIGLVLLSTAFAGLWKKFRENGIDYPHC